MGATVSNGDSGVPAFSSSSVHRLRAHVAAKTKLPILIFPEGQGRPCSRCGGGSGGLVDR